MLTLTHACSRCTHFKGFTKSCLHIWYEHSQTTNFSLDGSAPCQMISSCSLQIHTRTHSYTIMKYITCAVLLTVHIFARTSASSLLSFTLPMSCSAFISSLYPFFITIRFSSSFSFCCPISSWAPTLIMYVHTGCRSCLSARCKLQARKTHMNAE